MIQKIDASLIQEISPKPSQRHGKGTKAEQADASLQVGYASLIAQAIESDEAGPEQVDECKQLLLSGQLDTLQNISAAAENLADLGV